MGKIQFDVTLKAATRSGECVCVCVMMGNTVPVASVTYRLAMKGVSQVVSTSFSEIFKAKRLLNSASVTRVEGGKERGRKHLLMESDLATAVYHVSFGNTCIFGQR